MVWGVAVSSLVARRRFSLPLSGQPDSVFEFIKDWEALTERIAFCATSATRDARNSAVFTVGAVGGSLLLGLATALLLNQKLRWRNGARAVLFAPTLLSGAAIGIVWVYIFDPRFGLLARLLGGIGIGSPSVLPGPTKKPISSSKSRFRLGPNVGSGASSDLV